MSDFKSQIINVQETMSAAFNADRAHCNERWDVRERQIGIRHSITALWFFATAGGVYFAWSRWNQGTTLQQAFETLRARKWTPYELGAVGAYAILTLTDSCKDTIAQLVAGRENKTCADVDTRMNDLEHAIADLLSAHVDDPTSLNACLSSIQMLEEGLETPSGEHAVLANALSKWKTKPSHVSHSLDKKNLQVLFQLLPKIVQNQLDQALAAKNGNEKPGFLTDEEDE